MSFIQVVVPAGVSMVVAVTSLVCNLLVSKKVNSISVQSMAYESKRTAYTEYMSATYGIIDTVNGWESAARATYGLMLYAPDAISEKANRLIMLMNDAATRLEVVQKDNGNPIEDVVYMDYCAEFSHMAMALTRLLKEDISPKL